MSTDERRYVFRWRLFRSPSSLYLVGVDGDTIRATVSPPIVSVTPRLSSIELQCSEGNTWVLSGEPGNGTHSQGIAAHARLQLLEPVLKEVTHDDPLSWL